MKNSLEILFGSMAQWRILKFFLLNERAEFTLKEVAERNKVDIRKTLTVLSQLAKARFLTINQKKNTKTYITNAKFPFYPELKALVVKSNIFPQCESLGKVGGLGNVKLGLISGVFINYPKAKTDLLIVGDDISRAKLKHLLEDLEAEMGREIDYALMTTSEFKYRANMFDKFIMEVLEDPHEMVVNKMQNIISELTNARKSRLGL